MSNSAGNAFKLCKKCNSVNSGIFGIYAMKLIVLKSVTNSISILGYFRSDLNRDYKFVIKAIQEKKQALKKADSSETNSTTGSADGKHPDAEKAGMVLFKGCSIFDLEGVGIKLQEIIMGDMPSFPLIVFHKEGQK